MKTLIDQILFEQGGFCWPIFKLFESDFEYSKIMFKLFILDLFFIFIIVHQAGVISAITGEKMDVFVCIFWKKEI